MDLKLHANATTTPRTRAYIQNSQASNAALARELGIHPRTVARWKSRREVVDRSTRPLRLATLITAWEEGLIVELRRSLALPLDDIVEAMRRCINPTLSRSAIHRCLQRHGLSARLTPQKAPAAAFHTDAPAGFIHLDVKIPSAARPPPQLRRRLPRRKAGVAIDRATRFVYLEILPDRRAATAAGFLERFLARFPLTVHTVLTDNGSEFTDRFAVDKKAKPHDKPSGAHAFDRICTRHRITHRLIRPFHPQTSGMVERFNRRLGEHLDRRPQLRAHRRFRDHAERDTYLHTFVADYNRTRLRCLDYMAPAALLANLAGHNTKAGVARFRGWIEQMLAPTLRPDDIVLLDNLSSHKIAGIQEAIAGQGAQLVYLPPYSPDLNPIEQAFAKFKAALRQAAERTCEGLWQTIGRTLDRYPPQECRNFSNQAGYAT